MEERNRGMISYTSRDYDSIVEEFWNMVSKLTDLWRPESDADPGVVLGKFLASVADMLGVNLDLLATELFAPSVTQRKNAEKIFGLIGYTLKWYTAARTEVTFKNTSNSPMVVDFGFNGKNFSTMNAYTDITDQSRVITYNILPMTNTYGQSDSRSRREVVSTNIDVFSESDCVSLSPGESVVRVAIEGELRSYSVSVNDIKTNNYVINLPSQHVDTTAVWVKAKTSQSGDDFLETQWLQCEDPSQFVVPEPRFAVTYDNYSNAQIQISNYLNQLEDYDSNYLVIYWIDCSGVIGCVGSNALSNLALAKSQDDTFDMDSLKITNISNTFEIPHSNIVTGSSPETAKEAYQNSKNYINTWDSLVTLPDYNRFLSREPGVDCCIAIDCQKALDINMSIYNDKNLTDSQKSKMYITHADFPTGAAIYDWQSVLDLDFDPTDPNKFVFEANFKRHTVMCFAIHNDFQNSSYGHGTDARAKVKNRSKFTQYKPPAMFISDIVRDFTPLEALSTDIQFGYARIFKFYVVGQVFTKRPVSSDVGLSIIAKVREALKMYFAPAARSFGLKPSTMEVVNVVTNADSRISYFDIGSANSSSIVWKDCDPDYFNPISFARFEDQGASSTCIQIAPSCLIKEV